MKPIQHAKTHSPLGFSQAERYLNCAGSINACRGIPQRSAGPYAELGTAQHAMGEYGLLKDLDAADMVGGWYHDRDATAEMAEQVQPYLDAVRAIKAQAGPKALLLVEHVVNAKDLHPDLWGSIDAGVVVPFDHATIIDYKSGANAVEADCDQGKGYALCAFLMWDLETVTFVIVQPKAAHRDGPVRAKVYTRADMEREAIRFRDGAKATEDPNAPRKAGAWCKYCPAAPTCPELHQRAVVAAQMDFAKPMVAPKPPHELTDAQLRIVLEQADMITGWIKSVHAFALERANAGRPPEGYKLIAGRKGNRKWADEKAAEAALRFAEVEPFESSLLSVASAEKKIGKKAFVEGFGDLVTQSEGKPELAPVSDPRPAIAAGAAHDFSVVEDM